MKRQILIFTESFCLAVLCAFARAQSTNSQSNVDWAKGDCGVLMAVSLDTNVIAIGDALTVTEQIKNLSTNSVMLNSSSPYVLSDASGKTYELPIVLDMVTTGGPNVKGPIIIESKGFGVWATDVQIATNIPPGDFVVPGITQHMKTADNRACDVTSKPLKLRVIRR